MTDSPISILFFGALAIFLIACVIAGILRWAFRINRIVYLLENILQAQRDSQPIQSTPPTQKTINGIVIEE